MMSKSKKRLKSTVNVRNFVLSTTVCMLMFSASNEVIAGPVDQKPPEMLSYTQLDVPSSSIFEHRNNSMSFTSIEGEDMVTTTIGVYGHIRLESNFPSPLEYLSDVHQTLDNGYILAGENKIFKVAKNGEIEWNYMLGEENAQMISIAQLIDGTYIGAARVHNQQTNSNGLHMVRLTSTGEVVRIIDDNDESFDDIHSVRPTSDGGFVVSGEVYRSGVNEENIYLTKYDSTGKMIWTQYLTPSDDSENIKILSTVQGSNGQILASGYYNHPNPDGGYRYLTTGFVVAVGADGAKEWMRTPESTLDRSMLNDIQPTADGGYIATGKVNEDWHGTVASQWVWKLDTAGNTEWTKSIHRANYNAGAWVQPLSNGQSLLIGTADGSSTLIKLDAAK